MSSGHAAHPPEVTKRWETHRVVKLLVAVVGVAVLAYVAFVAIVGESPTWWTTTPVCTQPGDVQIADGGYGVWVKEPRLTLSLTSSRGPEAWVGRSASYGDSIDLHHGDPADLRCDWSDDGVTLIEAEGVEHVVPASVMISGR